MLPPIKSTLVADNFHYPIPISELEKSIISTHAFNRLHNILQNSTVYLTYPSNRTTRFIHSLGCMHIAGLIFQHSINNAKQDVRELFFDKVLSEINRIRDTEDFIRKTKGFIRNKDEETELRKNSINLLGDKLYLSALPGALRDEDQFAFIIIYQALRIAALLHDLGHPPFSHVTEQALEELKIRIRHKTEEKLTLTEHEKRFDEIVRNYSQEKFHEGLGETLAKRLLEFVEPRLVKCTVDDSKERKKYCYDILTIFQLGMNILVGESKTELSD